MLGSLVGSYKLVQKIGEGGMGAVYMAEHKLIGRKAAIKILLPEYSNNTEVINRFFNEAKATTAIHHPGIVGIFDFGQTETGLGYIVMEYLEGEGLTQRLRRVGKLSVEVAIQLTRQIASALHAAHQTGIVHRDLKPDNIILVKDSEVAGGERVKVLDFGIAKLGEALAGDVKTRAGSIMGTPTYMSPEQCRGASNIDKRADVYALGCMLFEFLCGRPPFNSHQIGELMASHMAIQPPTPRSLVPTIPERLEAVIMHMLAKNPDERFSGMSAVMRALDEAVPEVAVPRGADGAASGPVRISSSQPVIKINTQPSGGQKRPSMLSVKEAEQAERERERSTTMRSAAGESKPTYRRSGAKKQRLALLFGASFIVTGATAGALFALQPWKSGTPVVQPAAKPAAKPDTPTQPKAAADEDITVSITSQPSGALVLQDDSSGMVEIGKTPFKKTFPRVEGGLLEFKLTLAGHADQTVEVKTGESQSLDVVLKPAP